jgi:hypothetical protein
MPLQNIGLGGNYETIIGHLAKYLTRRRRYEFRQSNINGIAIIIYTYLVAN